MSDSTAARTPLTRDRILRAAVELADEHGVDSLTMRRLGASLDVEAMSLYRHVDGKDAILDGMVEVVVGAIEVPGADTPWLDAMRQRARSARAVLARHAWAIGLIESRGTAGAAVLRHTEGVLANLRAAGFGVDDAAHAFWVIDSYVYGHVVQEAALRARPAGASVVSASSATHPHLAELGERVTASPFDIDREFETGLGLVLDAVAGLLDDDRVGR